MKAIGAVFYRNTKEISALTDRFFHSHRQRLHQANRTGTYPELEWGIWEEPCNLLFSVWFQVFQLWQDFWIHLNARLCDPSYTDHRLRQEKEHDHSLLLWSLAHLTTWAIRLAFLILVLHLLHFTWAWLPWFFPPWDQNYTFPLFYWVTKAPLKIYSEPRHLRTNPL